MKMSKLSNQTNSQDPQAVNSRVFVGNLNTFQCSKTDVERMFQKYGRLAGISMHKGYAFVQFTNPFDARNACHGEDGRTILSQILDVNMVAEPKPHQIGRKRQNVTKTGNDWDYYYDSYYASTLFPTSVPRPIKRQRLMTPQTRGNVLVNAKVNSPQQQILHIQQQHQQTISNPISNGNSGTICNGGGGGIIGNGSSNTSVSGNSCSGGGLIVQHHNNTIGSSINTGCNGMNGETSTMYTNGHHQQQQHLLGPFKVYSNPDTLICGNCRECFLELGELLDHKRSYCKLRFTCKCQENSKNQLPSSTKLLCAVCKDEFSSPWDLMVHAQAAHMVNIYELGTESTNNNNVNVDDVQNNGTSIIRSSSVASNKIENGMICDDDELSDSALSHHTNESMNKEDQKSTINGDHISMNVSSPSFLPVHKGNDSPSSSRDSSPRPESATPPQACILSIEASQTSSLGIVTSSLLTIANGGPIVMQ